MNPVMSSEQFLFVACKPLALSSFGFDVQAYSEFGDIEARIRNVSMQKYLQFQIFHGR